METLACLRPAGGLAAGIRILFLSVFRALGSLIARTLVLIVVVVVAGRRLALVWIGWSFRVLEEQKQ